MDSVIPTHAPVVLLSEREATGLRIKKGCTMLSGRIGMWTVDGAITQPSVQNRADRFQRRQEAQLERCVGKQVERPCGLLYIKVNNRGVNREVFTGIYIYQRTALAPGKAIAIDIKGGASANAKAFKDATHLRDGRNALASSRR